MAKEVEFEITSNRVGELEDLIEREIPKFLEEVGMHIENQAKKAIEADPSRVDTGLLRNSITYALSGKSPHIQSYSADKPNEKGEMKTGHYTGTMPEDTGETKSVYIGTNVEYAPYVHEGHRMPNGKHVAANRFLQNAIEWNKEQIRRKLSDRLDSIK